MKSNLEWLLPTSIPFDTLKAKELEECVYWLMDALGAKDLEWRVGGRGGGATDGGRDLEAYFYTPGADGEIERQTWWIDCKGRKETVEPDAVKSVVTNAEAYAAVDYIVIVTNTHFSNPTRDWVKEWQKKHSKPKVKLWDCTQLERLLSQHPEVVLRLFSEALSLQGQLQSLENRFWNKFEFVGPKTLIDLWKCRKEVELSEMAIFAIIINEFANGDIVRRPWGAVLGPKLLLKTLVIGLFNLGYLAMRGHIVGISERLLARTFTYLILCMLDILPPNEVAELIMTGINRGEEVDMPEYVQELLLGPIADQMLSEMQDVCASDCKRITAFDRSTLVENKDAIDNYWSRFHDNGANEPAEKMTVLLEKLDEHCKVGFSVDKNNHCPLFQIQATPKNISEFMGIIFRVAAFRKKQAIKA